MPVVGSTHASPALGARVDEELELGRAILVALLSATSAQTSVTLKESTTAQHM
ncbi:MAG: hypothetical protein H7832_05235 [Magnetococcus sp. DMHC-6]